MILIISLVLFFCNSTKDYKGATPLEEVFDKESQAFAFVIPNLEPVEGVGGYKAKDCGTCHTTIYKEWKQTTHATALQDIQFQGELSKDSSPKWLCLNCHIPVQNQRKNIIKNLDDGNVLKPIKDTINPKFDKEFQQESISCASCHIRPDKNGKSVIIGAIGSENAPHPIKKDPTALRNICMRCHNPTGPPITKNLVCWFHTKEELESGPLADKKSCVDCHMPEKKRKIADAYPHLPDRITHQHHWVGGGIPKWYDSYDTLIERGYEPALKLTVKSIDNIKANDKADIKILLKNERGGHWIPTGDPERFIIVKAKLKNSSGKIIQEKKLKIGQHWQWDPAKKLDDNRLKPLEERPWNFQLDLPSNLNGITLEILAMHVKLSTKTAQYLKASKGVSEEWMKDAPKYVREAEKHYPFASFIHKEIINLSNNTKKKWSLNQLIEMSKKEQYKSLKEREY